MPFRWNPREHVSLTRYVLKWLMMAAPVGADKHDGILNAVAHHTHYGYNGNGKIQSNNTEIPDSNLNLCVELIAHRDQLELFCRKRGDLLKDKVVVYKHMEHWDIGDHRIKVLDVPQEELDVDVEDDVTESKQAE
jgi:PII-like signaling protein